MIRRGKETNPALLANQLAESIGDRIKHAPQEFSGAVARLLGGQIEETDITTLRLATFNIASPVLSPGIGSLMKNLTLDNPREGLSALVLSAFLLDQAQLPLEKRACTEFMLSEYQTLGLRTNRPFIDNLISSISFVFMQNPSNGVQSELLSLKADLVKKQVEGALPQSAQSKDDVKAWLPFIEADAIAYAFALDIRLSGKGNSIKDLMNHLFVQQQVILGSPYARELLLEGELDSLDPKRQADIFTRGLLSDYDSVKVLLVYFASHPALQEILWKRPHSINVAHLLALFLQDQEMIEGFFATIPNDYSPENRDSLAENIVTAACSIKEVLKREQIEEILQRLGVDETHVLDILYDKIPGALVLSKDMHHRMTTADPRPGQTEEAFRRKTGEQNFILYKSAMPWSKAREETRESTTSQEVAPKPEKARPKVNPAGIEFIEYWGPVGIVDANDIPVVINTLDQDLGVSEETAFALLDRYATVFKKGSVSHVIIPSLFKNAEPLMLALSSKGVVAVVLDGATITCIIDPKAAGIEVEGNLTVIAIKGSITDQNELSLTSDDLFLNPSHLLLNAAAVLARASIVVPPRKGKPLYSDEELRIINSRVDEWNIKAKPQGLPVLSFDQHKALDGPKVLVPVDRKFAFPTMLPS